jgi:N-acetylneuraminate synthase
VRWVADIGGNHNGDRARLRDLIHAAKEAGCTDFKLQMYNDEINEPGGVYFPPEIWLNKEWLPWIRDEADAIGIGFGCTPFYFAAVGYLDPFVDYFKIAVRSNRHDSLIAACSKTGKPLVVSLGSGGDNDLARIRRHDPPGGLTVLHCLSKYPAPVEECHLARIREDGLDGWSDHSRSPAVLYRAVHTYGAQMVEFHIDLDGAGWEAHTGHCWLPEEIAPVIRNCALGFLAD